LFWSTSDSLVAPATGAFGISADRNGECGEPLVSPFVGTVPPAIVPVGDIPLAGDIPVIATLFSPLNEPPGCHPHPYPGTNDHEPVWYGSHPQGYGDTHE
jgi:hypothetical protein